MNLIIVESPTKAKTFDRYLDRKDYQVIASMGHVRDLPEKKLSIDIENNFKPDYIITPKKVATVAKIKSLAKRAQTIILATDSDREGEAISYHIAYILGFIDEKWPEVKIKKSDHLQRIVFHEITKSALTEALKNPGSINLRLVDAQHTRRILDRLVGYKLSPLLWKKIGKRWLSAGRVQTVALRFVVEREKEIKNFKVESFYKVSGLFKNKTNHEIEAKLISRNGKPYEVKITITLFDGDYTYSKTDIEEGDIDSLKKDISTDKFVVEDVVEKIYNRTPPPPYITSTLQQDAAQRLGYSSKKTMKLAQDLYERGIITYHRTDSVMMAEKFLAESRQYIEKQHGPKYILSEPRRYGNKSKLAQEAHEAIRPTTLRPPSEVGDELDSQQKKIYELIFKRAVSTQMAPAQIKSVKVTIDSDKKYSFESSFEEIVFDGYLVLYSIKKEKLDIGFNKGDKIKLSDLQFIESQTTPPPRYSEASLIRTLEERGIGRPSTYAPTISTIQDRMYVEKQEGRFIPSMLGTAVCDYLAAAFSEILAIDFTANLEEDLDRIANGEEKMVTVLKAFDAPFEKSLAKAKKVKGFIDIEEKTDEKCPTCGKPLVIRFSKFGKFIGCSGYPDCKFTKSYAEKMPFPCPKCGGDILVRFTKRKRKFFGCANYPKCDFAAWKLHEIRPPVGFAPH